MGPDVLRTQSPGFRPQRSAHQAVAQAQQYIALGNRWVVDLDLEKFFDRVSHDKLMAAIARRESDKRRLKLIRAFLESGDGERAGKSGAERNSATAPTAGSPHGLWRLAHSPALQCAFLLRTSTRLGIPRLFEVLWLNRTAPPDADPHVLAVWQGRVGDDSPRMPIRRESLVRAALRGVQPSWP
jgi:hypothetical protein